MYYYKDKFIDEIYQIKHKHDDDKDFVDYGENMFSKSFSSFMFYNDNMENFLNKLKRLMTMFFDNVNIINNFKNYMVDKYYYKQKS